MSAIHPLNLLGVGAVPAGVPTAGSQTEAWKERTFRPGKSGNPGGFTKREKRLTDICRQYAAGKSMYALKKLVALMECDDPRVVYMAATAILDRAGVRATATPPSERREVTDLGYVVVPAKNPVAADAPTNTLPGVDRG